MTFRERRSWTAAEDDALRAAVLKEDPNNHPPSKWHAIARHVATRTNKDCRKRYFAKMASVVAKGGWSNDEDERLIRAVHQYGTKWSLVAAVVETRNNDQCAKRWSDTLNPAIDRTPWTVEEDERLVKAVEEEGKSWTKIVRTKFPGRTGLSAKNRYSRITRMANQEASNASRTIRRRAPTRAPYSLAMRKSSSSPTHYDEQAYSPEYNAPSPDFSQSTSAPTCYNNNSRLTSNTLTSLSYSPSSVEEWRRYNNSRIGVVSADRFPNEYAAAQGEMIMSRFKQEVGDRWEPKPEPQDPTPPFTPPRHPSTPHSYFSGHSAGGVNYDNLVQRPLSSMDVFPPARRRATSFFPGLFDEQQHSGQSYTDNVGVGHGNDLVFNHLSQGHLETTGAGSQWSSPVSDASMSTNDIQRGHHLDTHDSFVSDCYDPACSQDCIPGPSQQHRSQSQYGVSGASMPGFWTPPFERVGRLTAVRTFSHPY